MATDGASAIPVTFLDDLNLYLGSNLGYSLIVFVRATWPANFPSTRPFIVVSIVAMGGPLSSSSIAVTYGSEDADDQIVLSS